jgi:outer membrane receptor protein involved in Fe transport
MCTAVRHHAMPVLGGLLLCLGGAAVAAPPDPTRLSVEELLEVSVYSASKFAQKTTEAPAAVTVITAEDIRAYGYRTLADILKGVRGFFVTYDRNYAYLGVRGFERPGDYDSRILLLVDGYRVNDIIYDTAGIGTEFAIDVDLIERLEIVRGPGSAIYGSNAFFAVINVITRRGRDIGTLEASGEVGSFRTDKERLATGGKVGGVEWMLAGSRYRSEGQDLYFAGFDAPATHNGIAQGLDGDEYQKAFGKLSTGGLAVTAGYSEREKHIPTASYETAFNDPRFQTTDTWEFVDLDYRHALPGAWELSPRVSYSRYTYGGDYPYGPAPNDINRDASTAQWWATEIKLGGRIGRHRLVTGVEYQDNFQQDQSNYDENPFFVYLDDRNDSNRAGVYIEDEYAPTGPLRISAGIRFDHYSTAGTAFSPRAGLVWNPREQTALKALVGTAFRAPNNYELYYGDNATIVPNPNLEPEEIATYELVAENYFDANFRLTADAYMNVIHNLIDQVPSGGAVQFQNIGSVRGSGLELELERVWANDLRARASYAWQETRDRRTDVALTNSPHHLAKLNVAVPLLGRALTAGAEAQYVSSRTTLAGATTGGATVANVTLVSRPLANRFEISVSAYNVLDHDYSDPARPEHATELDEIPQDGRSFRLKLSYGL